MSSPAAQNLLKKHLCIPFLDTSGGSGTASWTRIDKSTVFALNPNPQEETYDYICDEMPTTEVDHYEPELPQEIAMYENNPMYEFIFNLFYSLPTGSALNVPCLICFPGTAKKAWKIAGCTVVLGEMNTVDKKITFTLKFGGNIDRGTYTLSGGTPTFTSASSSGGSGGSGGDGEGD